MPVLNKGHWHYWCLYWTRGTDTTNVHIKHGALTLPMSTLYTGHGALALPMSILDAGHEGLTLPMSILNKGHWHYWSMNMGHWLYWCPYRTSQNQLPWHLCPPFSHHLSYLCCHFCQKNETNWHSGQYLHLIFTRQVWDDPNRPCCSDLTLVYLTVFLLSFSSSSSFWAEFRLSASAKLSTAIAKKTLSRMSDLNSFIKKNNFMYTNFAAYITMLTRI